MKKSKILKKLLKEDPPGEKHIFVISISGGKDSKATLIVSLPLLLDLIEPDQIKVVFCDTGWEKKETIEEIKDIKLKLDHLGIEFIILKNENFPNGMVDLITHKKMFPSRKTKFCTDQLKMIPALNYYKKLHLSNFKVIALVGKRRDESEDRRNTKEQDLHTYRDYNFTTYHPIADWTETDVYSFLDETWGIPSSYFKGNKRVGCDECFQADLKSISLMSQEKVEIMSKLENNIAEFHQDKDYTPAFFYKKNKTFPQGFAPIKEVVKYAKNKYNFNYFTFHTRALKTMSNKIGQKTLRYKFIQFGYIPDMGNFSKYINGILAVPQSMLFDIEILTTRILSAKERKELLNFEMLKEIEREDNNINCDCESYNLL